MMGRPGILKDEIEAALKRMKKGKATGEMLEELGEFGMKYFTCKEGKRRNVSNIFLAKPKIQEMLENNKHRIISIMSHRTKNDCKGFYFKKNNNNQSN